MNEDAYEPTPWRIPALPSLICPHCGKPIAVARPVDAPGSLLRTSDPRIAETKVQGRPSDR